MRHRMHSAIAVIVTLGKCSRCILRLFVFVFCAGIAFCGFAAAEEPVSLNEAVDDGLVRIVQSRSPGGYSRFMIELENLSNKPISVDPYGSAFDPPRGVRTQRIGIGLPTKIGNQPINLRKRLSTDPSQEAPVGSDASRDSSGAIPDAALPAAAGAAAVGTLLVGMAQGVRPREALSDLAGLIRGDADTATGDVQNPSNADYQIDMIKSYRDQDMTELDYQKQRLDAAKKQGAQDVVRDAEAAVGRLSTQIDSYDKNLSELGEKPIEHTELEKRSFDYTRKDLADEVRTELADKAAGTISDSDRIGIDLWITDNAPTQQAYDDMTGLVDKMTVSTKDGTTIGDKQSILTSLGKELQRTNQPHYTYFENYSLREEVMEDAKKSPLDDVKKIKDGLTDLNETVKTISPDTEQLDELAKTQQEGWEKDGGSPGGAAADKIDKATKIFDAGSTIYNDSKGYMAAGNSRTLAVTKAVTQYGVDLGVGTLMDKNPVMKVVNTALKYSEPVIGKDISPGKGWRILTDKAFDSYTGELDHKDVDRLDFDSAEAKDIVREGQVKGLEGRLDSSGLTDAERQEITDRLRELRGK
jgi:hypothetical protein